MKSNKVLSCVNVIIWSLSALMTVGSAIVYSEAYGVHFIFAAICLGLAFFVYKRNDLLQNEKEIIVKNKNLTTFIKFEIITQIIILFIGLVAISAIISRVFHEHTSLFD